MNRFINAIVCGAGAALGSVIVTKIVDDLSDPYKKANIKNFIKGIKSKLFMKKES